MTHFYWGFLKCFFWGFFFKPTLPILENDWSLFGPCKDQIGIGTTLGHTTLTSADNSVLINKESPYKDLLSEFGPY